jgi:perosamine synthetase
MKIPVSRPFIGEEEKELVDEALKRTEISGMAGSFIPRLEDEFAAYCGSKYGVAVSNGTTALHLALATLGIGPGDEVLVDTFTNMASFFAVHYTGATPVPVDIEPDTWNLDPKLIEEKITPATKAIMVVHIYGHPTDMDPVLEIARKHKLFIVEDCAEAHGAEYKGKRVGSLGDIGCFSFYANKILTTGEGGMLTMNDSEYADRARSLRSLAYGKGEQKFMHSAIGFNYRLSNVLAAIGCAQLSKIEETIAHKRKIADFYNKQLGAIQELQLPVEKSYAKNVYWMFQVVLRGSMAGKRKIVMEELNKRGIETREAFMPYNLQEIFIKRGLVRKDDCPVANNIGENGFYLPSGPIMSEEELGFVTDSIEEIISIYSKK